LDWIELLPVHSVRQCHYSRSCRHHPRCHTIITTLATVPSSSTNKASKLPLKISISSFLRIDDGLVHLPWRV
jgi:hypothetical protein